MGCNDTFHESYTYKLYRHTKTIIVDCEDETRFG